MYLGSSWFLRTQTGNVIKTQNITVFLQRGTCNNIWYTNHWSSRMGFIPTWTKDFLISTRKFFISSFDWKTVSLIFNWFFESIFVLQKTIPKSSHYIEVAQGDIFMEQKMWFGLVLGRLAILKKKSLGRLWATFEDGFFMFSRAKNF